MIQYNKSTIYKLCCKDANITEIYIGSTTNFRLRKSQHKNKCKNENGKAYNFKVYKFIRENGGFENWSMVEIEKVNATDKKDLEKIERRFIDELKPILNCRIPGRTQKEYCADNSDKIKKYRVDNSNKIKKYRVDNSDKNKKYQIGYRADNSDKIKKYQIGYRADNSDKNKEYHKQYYSNNSDKFKEIHKQYYSDNSDKFKEKIECNCGSTISRCCITRHNNSKKHTQYLESLENIPYGSNFIFLD